MGVIRDFLPRVQGTMVPISNKQVDRNVWCCGLLINFETSKGRVALLLPHAQPIIVLNFEIECMSNICVKRRKLISGKVTCVHTCKEKRSPSGRAKTSKRLGQFCNFAKGEPQTAQKVTGKQLL